MLVLTPVYNHFFIAIDNSGCTAAECELTYSGNRYTVDFDALERRAADPAVKLMLLCNPHNPAGRVWTPEELRRIGDICLRRDILVVADEIHCELVDAGIPPHPLRLAFGGVRAPLGHLRLAQQGVQPRGSAGCPTSSPPTPASGSG